MRCLLVIGCLLAASLAWGAEHDSWNAYLKKNRYACPGPFDTLKKPRKLIMGGKTYVHSGYQMKVEKPDADKKVKIGVVSAIKDVTAGTQQNLTDAFAWFKKAGVEWVVVNGDIALEEFDLEEILDRLGESGFPVLLVLGNSESKGSFARVYRERAGKYPNLVNGVLVRQIIADDVTFWTMPGYYDRRFAHQGATCGYTEEAADQLLAALDPTPGLPVALVSHGPPLGRGKNALDWVVSDENVGDPLLSKIIKEKKIPFGLFGHILEAGGRAVGSDMATPIKPGKAVKALYLNAGSLSGDPWGLNDGTTSYGMAVLVVIDGEKAQYEVRRYPARFDE